jgi:class 3 adenylate cyclase
MIGSMRETLPLLPRETVTLLFTDIEGSSAHSASPARFSVSGSCVATAAAYGFAQRLQV